LILDVEVRHVPLHVIVNLLGVAYLQFTSVQITLIISPISIETTTLASTIGQNLRLTDIEVMVTIVVGPLACKSLISDFGAIKSIVSISVLIGRPSYQAMLVGAVILSRIILIRILILILILLHLLEEHTI
jgi:hypothetical protein